MYIRYVYIYIDKICINIYIVTKNESGWSLLAP